MVSACRIVRFRRAGLSLAFLASALFSASAASAQASSAKIAGDDFHALGDSPSASDALTRQPSDVRTIFRLTNRDRAAEGLLAVSWSPVLAAAALAHARLMAVNGQLTHRFRGEPDLAARASQAGAHFSSIDENIALGNSAPQLDRAWMHSPPHRANILDPRMNALGVAVVASGGALYAVQDFAGSIQLLTPGQAEARVEAELRNLPPDAEGNPTGPGDSLVLRDREEARRHCAGSDALLPGSQARYVVRWQASELTLPQPLVDALRGGRYPAAAVGACAPMGTAADGGFALYRFAVLLY